MVTREGAVTSSPRTRTAPSRQPDRPAIGRLRVSHPDRVIDPRSGLTKLELVRYYDEVSSHLLRHVRGRAVAQVRGPTGVGGPLFFQRHDASADDPGAPLRVDSRKALLEAAQLNTIEWHTGNVRLRAPGSADRMVFDLDPGQGVRFERVREVAQLLRGQLQQLRLRSWLKTSGGKGLHLVVPLAPRWTPDAVRTVAKAIVEHLARTRPERVVARSGPSRRVGRIFIDYLRNGDAATTVAAFSARARPGMGVSMPLAWDALDGLPSADHWTVRTALDHLARQAEDPWAGYWRSRQSLDAASRAFGLEIAPAP